jgi:hypothetical protein
MMVASHRLVPDRGPQHPIAEQQAESDASAHDPVILCAPRGPRLTLERMPKTRTDAPCPIPTEGLVTICEINNIPLRDSKKFAETSN